MTENTKDSAMIIGEVASSGVARGLAFVCGCAEDMIVPRRAIAASEAAQEMERFDTAIFAVEQDLLKLPQTVLREIGKSEAGIMEAQILLLGKTVSICGQMAGNPMYMALLLGLGFRSLSASPGEILEIKNVIRSTSLQQAEHVARQILQLGTIQEIKNSLRDARAQTQ